MKRLLLALTCGVTAALMTAVTPIGFDPIGTRKAGRPTSSAEKHIKAPQTRAADLRSFNANLYYQGDWEYQTPQYGVYAFPAVAGNYSSFPKVAGNPLLCGNAGAVYAEGKYFVATAEEVNAPNGGYVVMSMHFYLFDTENNWQWREIPDADEEFKAMDMAYNPIDGKVYGCFVQRGADGYYYFGTLDIETGKVAMIRNYGQDSRYSFTGIAISDEGTIYGINSGGGLYSIDPNSGSTTLIAETGLQDQYMTSAAFDSESGKIYYALNSDMLNGIYTLNPRNGAAQRLYSFTDEESLAGMYFPDPEPLPETPAAPTSIEASFTGGSLSGSVDITLPTLSRGGSPLSGYMECTLAVNGTEMYSGSGAPGATLSIPLTLPADGEYLFTILLSNEFGAGSPARLRIYAGHDTPTPPSNVGLTLESGNLNVTWDPSSPIHGGYLSPQLLSYKLIRYPDMAETTVSGTQTSFSVPLPPIETRTHFRYTVAAIYRDFTSEAASSPSISTGSYLPPFNEDFNEPSTMADFINIDGDGDGKAWVWEKGQVRSQICLISDVDDTLITPPVRMQAGKSYQVSLEAKATRSPTRIYPERIALFAGTDPQQMNLEVLAPTVVDWDEYRTLTATFTPPADGEYRLGINACSDMDMYWLWVDNLQVSAPFVSDVPAPVADLTVSPDASGLLSARLDFTLPALTMSGAPLSAIEKVLVYRDGEPAATLAGTPGQHVSWTDTGMTNGEHEYAVAVLSSFGQSPLASCTAYVGVYRPRPVEGAQVVHGSDSGLLTLSWQTSVVDIEGRTLPEGSVTYEITRFDRDVTILGESIPGNSFSDRVSSPDASQKFVQYEIIAVGAGGKSDPVYTNIVTAGKFIPTPATESFAGGASVYEFVVERDDDNASWTVTNDASNPGVSSSDGDEGLLRFIGVSLGDWANFHSGTFDVSSLENAALTFDYLYPRGIDTGLSITLEWEENGMLVSRRHEVVPDSRIEGWQRFILPLEEGISSMRFFLTGINETDLGINIFVDNIALSSLPTPNAGILRLDAPSLTLPGEPFKISALVENSGLGSVDAYVSLYKEGVEIGTRSIVIAQGEKVSVEFEDILPMVLPAPASYHVEVSVPGDRVEADNRSGNVEVLTRYGHLPAPRNLMARSAGDAVSISWDEPDLGPQTPTRIFDGAEEYRSFSIGSDLSELYDDYMGMWTTLDRDGYYTLGVGHGSESIPNSTEKKGFMVFSLSESGMTSEAFRPASGDKMFVAFASVADYGTGNDDWLISPRLSGENQTVTFKARTCTDLYGLEHLEVLYTMGGDSSETGSYISLLEDPEVPGYWKSYTVTLPAGATHFAIRCKSENKFALLIDDIEYTPLPLRQTGLEVTEYKLWCDGIYLISLNPALSSYTLPLPGEGLKPAYRLTAIYGDAGESRPSSEAILDDFSGLTDLIQDTDTEESFFTLQGLPVAGKPDTSGVYLRKRGRMVEKIIIK